MKLLAHIGILGLTIILFSCNLTQQYINKSEKHYDRWGRSSWVTELDSASIFWRKIGSGDQKILLIHGFGPVPQVQWEDLVEELYADYTVYIPDLIYFGNSTSSSDNYDPRFLSRKLLESFNQFENGDFYLAGVSYGGLIAAISAGIQPEKVKGLILIDALSRNMDRNYADSLAEKYGYQDISKVLIPMNGKALKTLFKLTFYKPPGYPSWLLNKPAEELYGSQRIQKTKLMQFLIINETRIKNWNFRYDGPVLVIWGEEDILIPKSNALLIRDQYTNADLEIIPRAAHAVNMENADEVGELIKNMVGNKNSE